MGVNMRDFLFLLGALVLGYWCGFDYASDKADLKFSEFQLKSEREYNQLLQDKINQNSIYTAKINKIEQKRLKDIEQIKSDYETSIVNMRKSFIPSGLSKCPASKDCANTKNSNTDDLVCYAKSELYERIKKTLAIGARADEQAINYNALINAIEEYNSDKK